MPLFRHLQAYFSLVLLLCCATALSAQQHHDTHHSHRHHDAARHVMHNGNSVERRNGRVSEVHDERRHMDVHHHLAGGRRISVARADHSRIVAEYGRGGYIEHPYAYGGRDYYRRTYYYRGHVYSHFYRSYAYHGFGLHVWAPGAYYSRTFYGWAYHPWHTRVYYTWDWVHRPWYGYYGYYFQPYPSYVGASAWLTDYTISHDLQADYQARSLTGGEMTQPIPTVGGDNPALLTQETKDEVGREIDYELEVENGEAALETADHDADAGSSGIPRLFSDKDPHIFVVAAPLDVENEATGDECALSNGDILRTTTAPGPDEKTASLTVIASKQGKSECAKSSVVTVNLDDLQEMQNSLRETIHDGLGELQQKQGTEGIPALPTGANAPVVTPQFAKLAPPPDPNAQADIDQQYKEADQSEHEVTTQETAEPEATTPIPTQAPAPIERPSH